MYRLRYSLFMIFWNRKGAGKMCFE